MAFASRLANDGSASILAAINFFWGRIVVYRRTSKTELRKQQRRETILRSTRSIISARGFSGTRAKDIAKAAGVSEGTVFRYFPTLIDLFVEVFRDVAGGEFEVAKAATLSTDRPRDRLAAVVRLHVERALRSPGLARALLAEPLGAELESVRLTYRGYFRDLFAQIMKDAINAGQYRPFDVLTAAACMIGAVDETLILPTAVLDAKSGDDKGHVSFVVQFCMNGIAPWHIGE